MSQAFKTDGFLSYDLTRWPCSLTYEDLSPGAIERAKAFRFDSLGCALGGSEQEDAVILLAHHREIAGDAQGACTCFVTGFKTNPVDAAFLSSHMIRAMDFNDIYWKADPSHPSDILGAPLALCELKGLGSKDLILATVIAYEIEMRLDEIAVKARALGKEIVGEERVDAIRDCVLGLEKLESVDRLIALMTR